MIPYNKKIIKYTIIILVLLILSYAFFEARNIIYGPQINLMLPNKTITVHSPIIQIKGNVKYVISISLDGRTIKIDRDGNFTEKLLLIPGLNTFTFKATNKFGKTQNKEIMVIYKKDNNN